MGAVFGVTVPFFALVAIGWLAARRGLLPLEAVPGLNAFVLFFALPCMLFRFGARLPVRELLNPAVLGVYLAAGLLMVALTVLSTRGRGTPPLGMTDAAFGALVAAFPNSGFMGVPLLVALAGQAAAGPVISSLLVDFFVISSLCLALSQWQGAGSGALTAAGRSLRAALANPLPWSIGLGAFAAESGLVLPGPVDKVVAMLADAASPVALFTIGAVLWRSSVASQAASQGGHGHTPLTRTLPVALLKLLLHPLLLWALGRAAQAAGVPLTPFALTVLVMCAALPSASNVAMLAERYGADNGRVARIILGSTALAFLTFPALAWWLGVQPGAGQ